MSKKGQIRRNTVDCVDTVITVQYTQHTQRFNDALNVLAQKFGFSIEDANQVLNQHGKNFLQQEDIARILKTYDGAITENGQPLSDGKGLLMQASKWGKMVQTTKVVTGITTGATCSYIINAGSVKQHQCKLTPSKTLLDGDDHTRCDRHQPYFLNRQAQKNEQRIKDATPPTTPQPQIQIPQTIDVKPLPQTPNPFQNEQKILPQQPTIPTIPTIAVNDDLE